MGIFGAKAHVWDRDFDVDENLPTIGRGRAVSSQNQRRSGSETDKHSQQHLTQANDTRINSENASQNDRDNTVHANESVSSENESFTTMIEALNLSEIRDGASAKNTSPDEQEPLIFRQGYGNAVSNGGENNNSSKQQAFGKAPFEGNVQLMMKGNVLERQGAYSTLYRLVSKLFEPFDVTKPETMTKALWQLDNEGDWDWLVEKYPPPPNQK